MILPLQDPFGPKQCKKVSEVLIGKLLLQNLLLKWIKFLSLRVTFQTKPARHYNILPFIYPQKNTAAKAIFYYSILLIRKQIKDYNSMPIKHLISSQSPKPEMEVLLVFLLSQLPNY